MKILVCIGLLKLTPVRTNNGIIELSLDVFVIII